MHAKVNPPIRPREDVEALWQAVLDRKIDWIVSDHACCSAEQKWSKDDPTNIWLAKAGFGGTEYLLSGVLSEGSKRGMSYHHMAELLQLETRATLRPAATRAISPPATMPTSFWSIRTRASCAMPRSPNLVQGYTPFEGVELTGRVKRTFLSGGLIYDGANVVGPARGEYLRKS